MIKAGERITRESGEHVMTFAVNVVTGMALSAHWFEDSQIGALSPGMPLPFDEPGKRWWRGDAAQGIHFHIEGRGWV